MKFFRINKDNEKNYFFVQAENQQQALYKMIQTFLPDADSVRQYQFVIQTFEISIKGKYCSYSVVEMENNKVQD